MSWKRALVWLVFGSLALAAALLLLGAGAEFVLSRRDARRFQPPGRLVDVGGRKLHLQCTGAGEPTIVFEMGAGAWGLFWTDISREMSKVTRVCVYDRAGFGWSDPAPLPRSVVAPVADLRTLLHRSGERGPLVLVGHSLGGLLIRLYRDRYPEDVVGMALVESAHPHQWAELPPEIWELTQLTARRLRMMGRVGRFGFLRLMADALATQQLPQEIMPAYRATAVRPSALSAFAAEILTSDSLAAEVDQSRFLGDLPLVVVSAARSFDAFRELTSDWPFDEANAVWMKLQRELLTLSSCSWHHVSPQATHNIHTGDPDLVVKALEELVEAVRARSGSRE